MKFYLKCSFKINNKHTLVLRVGIFLCIENYKAIMRFFSEQIFAKQEVDRKQRRIKNNINTLIF